jgi:hypothetical protein
MMIIAMMAAIVTANHALRRSAALYDLRAQASIGHAMRSLPGYMATVLARWRRQRSKLSIQRTRGCRHGVTDNLYKVRDAE